MGQPAEYLKDVREHYEALPYPPRPKDYDIKNFSITWGDQLDYVNMRFWKGEQPFDSSFRALVAGCGTGDSVVFLAEQLREHGARVTALDMSSASLDVLRARLETRKLDNVDIVHASILDLPTLDLGTFHYINCSGVLHHMESPSAGLRALRDALKDDGVLHIMVYARYGREGIYQMQDLMRRLRKPEDSHDDALALFKEVYTKLPPSNWMHHLKEAHEVDIHKYGDSGIYDMFLHSQDRAYNVKEIYEWVDECDLHMAEFTPPVHTESWAYHPSRFGNPPEILAERYNQLDKQQLQFATELLGGNFTKHQFYATKNEPAETLDPMDESLVPAFSSESIAHMFQPEILAQKIGECPIGEAITLKTKFSPSFMIFTRNEHTVALVLTMNNRVTVGEMVRSILRRQPNQDDATREKILQDWEALADELSRTHNLVLRTKDSPAMTPVNHIQIKMFERAGIKVGQ